MIGVFGGTFDPVHLGHLLPVKSVADSLSLSQVRFVPNRHPPHRDTPWLSVAQRLSLLETALRDYARFELDTCELERDGPSYMIDTLLSVRQRFPGETLLLILGMDALLGFERWHRWRDILESCHLLVTRRPGFADSMHGVGTGLASRITDDRRQLMLQDSGRILLESAPRLAISSSEIRQRLQHGGDVSEFLPAAVNEQLKGFVKHD